MCENPLIFGRAHLPSFTAFWVDTPLFSSQPHLCPGPVPTLYSADPGPLLRPRSPVCFSAISSGLQMPLTPAPVLPASPPTLRPSCPPAHTVGVSLHRFCRRQCRWGKWKIGGGKGKGILTPMACWTPWLMVTTDLRMVVLLCLFERHKI